MSRLRRFVKPIASLAIVAGVVFFFWRAVSRSWDDIRAHDFQFDYPFVALCFAGVIASSLLATLAWQVALNSLSEQNEMTFSQSVAIVNTTSLTKYLPGKLWSFAIQMYWLVGHGYSKSLVLYVNIVNLMISMLTGVILSLGLLLFTNRFPIAITLSALGLLLLVDLSCVVFHAKAFQLMAALVKRFLKREMGSYDLSLRTMGKLHAIHMLGQVISAAGAYLLCFGIGYQLEARQLVLVMSALILADTAGFLAVLVPAGIGVREGTMYLLIGGAAAGSLAVVLPIASRMVMLVADALLGAFALKLLRSSIHSDEADEQR